MKKLTIEQTTAAIEGWIESCTHEEQLDLLMDVIDTFIVKRFESTHKDEEIRKKENLSTEGIAYVLRSNICFKKSLLLSRHTNGNDYRHNLSEMGHPEPPTPFTYPTH